MKYAGVVGIILLLLFCSYEDISRKRIKVRSILLEIPFFLVDFWANTIMTNEISIISRLAGLILGGIFVGISVITRGQMGKGDGYLIGVIGINLGFFITLEMITYSLILAAIIAIILLVFFHVSRKKAIPFIPFLSGGFLCCVLLGGKII